MKKRGRPRNFDRQEALKKAMMAFWAHGYEGTSMAALVKAMNINSPSIYAAFGSKENLFQEAVTLYRTTEGGRIWTAALAEPTARSAVATMLKVSAKEFSQPNKPGGCLVVLGAIHAAGDSDAVYQKLKEYRAESIATLMQIFKRAVSEGELSDQTDLRAVARYYVAVQQGMSIQARDGASRQSLLTVAESAMAAWENLTDC
ncbi:TetR/AcrR family transcriptional regulator [Marinimicrobium locisalis]|uniref:TetR/AcrR family transcriptional regulator n=1 Tax=Marinimicrobium locisalis TaxID=546022 RepID=UPI003221EFF6